MMTSEMNEDRLSDLPDEMLLIIMSFIKIKQAVQTCTLSKRFKSLWKFLPNITLHSNDFTRNHAFDVLVSRIVSGSDHNHTLQSLDFYQPIYFPPSMMTNLMSHALCHNIQHLKINVPFNVTLPARVFSCSFLTSLHLSIPCNILRRTRLPKSLQLPKLLSLHLENVPISTDENGLAEPFSNCKKLNTLYMDDCELLSPEAFVVSETLCVTNVTLANLTMNFMYARCPKIVLSTPNLSSFTFEDCDFTYRGLKEVNVEE